MRILVVEDSITMLRVIKRTLNSFGYTDIEEAWDGTQGIARMSESEVDIILTDRNMPGMDGVSFTKKVRKINKIIPILMISVEGKPENILEAMHAGVSDYIVKPFSSHILEEKIKHFLNTQENHLSQSKPEGQGDNNRSPAFCSLNIDKNVMDSIDTEEVQQIDGAILLKIFGNAESSKALKEFTEAIINDEGINVKLKEQIIEQISFLITQYASPEKKQKSFIKKNVLSNIKETVSTMINFLPLWENLEPFFEK